MISHVYVACKGEHGGGHSPISVHADLLHALAAYRDEIDERPLLRRNNAHLVELDGCDELWFYRFNVPAALPEVKGRSDAEVTIDEAALTLGLSRVTVARWVQLGRLSSRLGKRADGRGRGVRLVKRADVQRLADAGVAPC